MESPLQTMWKWHLINELRWLMADTLEASFIHKRIARAIFEKEHVTDSTAKGGIFKNVGRHQHDANLVRYGDLFKARVQGQSNEEETSPE